MPTALIVEDEPQANKLLAMLVQLHGYTTESAFTGQEALDKVRAHVPDVVFLDLMLPDLDGYEVCRALKASGVTSQVPVVIVTARIAAENRIESFDAGADDYVPKPYTPDQIFNALDESMSFVARSPPPRSKARSFSTAATTVKRSANSPAFVGCFWPQRVGQGINRPDQRGHQGHLVQRRRMGASFGPRSCGDSGVRTLSGQPGIDGPRRGGLALERGRPGPRARVGRARRCTIRRDLQRSRHSVSPAGQATRDGSMSSVSGLEPADRSHKEAASPDEADRAFRLALTAWGDRCRRPVDDREPGEAPAHSPQAFSSG